MFATRTLLRLPLTRTTIVGTSYFTTSTMSSSAPPPETPKSQATVLVPAQPAGQFTKSALYESEISSSPLDQFSTWFNQAISHPITQAEACTLSTASLPSGHVSSRVVYFKSLDDRGFIVFSNWGTSRKSEDLRSNSNASMSFWWKELQRQVRIEGIMSERLSKEEEQTYFDSRVRVSRIGAWASRQSEVLKDRKELEDRVEKIEKKFDGQEIPVPEFWGGMRLVPESIEFWQGREGRLHDRLKYTKDENTESGWKVERLSP
jgi:pyridoxamine 5'-phosphate oxidase